MAAAACRCSICISVSAHCGSHYLFVQRRRCGRISAARSYPQLVSHASCRRRDLGIGGQQPPGGAGCGGDRFSTGNSGSARARPRAISWEGLLPASGPSPADSAGDYHGPFAVDALPHGSNQAQPAYDRAGAWNGTDFGGDHGRFRGPAKAGSRTGRSFSRPGRQLHSNVLAGHAAESEIVHHWGCSPYFTLSMDEISVSFFLIGRENTLPLEIWARLRRGITPEINAISTIIFVFSLVAIVLWYRLRARAQDAPEIAAELVETAFQGD